MKQFRKKVKKSNIYREYARVLNGILDLSPREMEIFALLLRIDSEWRPILTTDTKNILSTDNRRKIMRETHVNKNNLSKYISILKERGILVKNAYEGWEVTETLSPSLIADLIEIVFTLDTRDDGEE